MLTSAPKASATILDSASSSNAGLLLTSTLSHLSSKSAVHSVLDEDGSRTGHCCPQHNLAVLHCSAPVSCAERKVPESVSLPNVGEPVRRLTIS